jgi:hypothetical protein
MGLFIIALILVFIFLLSYQIFLDVPYKEGMDNNTTTTTDTTTTDTTTGDTTTADTTADTTTTDTSGGDLESRVAALEEQVSQLVQQQADLATQLVGDTPPTITGTDMSA